MLNLPQDPIDDALAHRDICSCPQCLLDPETAAPCQFVHLSDPPPPFFSRCCCCSGRFRCGCLRIFVLLQFL